MHIAKLSPSPSSNWAVAGSIPSFSDLPTGLPTDPPTIQNSTFQASYGLNSKSKVVDFKGETLEMSPDLNPISHWGHLTQF